MLITWVYRWMELVELIKKSLLGSQAHQSVNNTRRQLLAHNDMDGGTSSSVAPTMEHNSLRQQAEELYKKISQQCDVVDGPLQKLCNALYTCDPHRTGKSYIFTLYTTLSVSLQHTCNNINSKSECFRIIITGLAVLLG